MNVCSGSVVFSLKPTLISLPQSASLPPVKLMALPQTKCLQTVLPKFNIDQSYWGNLIQNPNCNPPNNHVFLSGHLLAPVVKEDKCLSVPACCSCHPLHPAWVWEDHHHCYLLHRPGWNVYLRTGWQACSCSCCSRRPLPWWCFQTPQAGSRFWTSIWTRRGTGGRPSIGGREPLPTVMPSSSWTFTTSSEARFTLLLPTWSTW